jgi:hypothetical protein
MNAEELAVEDAHIGSNYVSKNRHKQSDGSKTRVGGKKVPKNLFRLIFEF